MLPAHCIKNLKYTKYLMEQSYARVSGPHDKEVEYRKGGKTKLENNDSKPKQSDLPLLHWIQVPKAMNCGAHQVLIEWCHAEIVTLLQNLISREEAFRANRPLNFCLKIWIPASCQKVYFAAKSGSFYQAFLRERTIASANENWTTYPPRLVMQEEQKWVIWKVSVIALANSGIRSTHFQPL